MLWLCQKPISISVVGALLKTPNEHFSNEAQTEIRFYGLKKLKTIPQHTDRSQAKVKKRKKKIPENELLTLSLLPRVNTWCCFSRTKHLLFWTCCHWLISTNTEHTEGFCVRQSLRLLRGSEARGVCGTDSASAAPATFLFTRFILDVHREQTP